MKYPMFWTIKEKKGDNTVFVYCDDWNLWRWFLLPSLKDFCADTASLVDTATVLISSKQNEVEEESC